ncbi:M48 family metalloprotease [Arenivirga flava]|uniref:Protease HtpX homolog n=1 Tax=Arenivirga flava TaxID=1930060 RepID=A0AA37UEJ5_9MICO|nr:M48 family metalloprotease [Arenivirga flava]GMA28120.1 protease HtpX [Arenivirga flava]
MYRAIAANKRKTVLIIAAFILIVGAIGFIGGYFAGNTLGYGVTTLVIAGGYATIQYFLASSQALSMSGAREISKADEPRLYRIVENLAITTGMPMPKVYVIDDPAPNAFATGTKPEKAVVAATTGLLDIMDDAELEGVMAHELGHVRNYDIRVSLIVFGLVVAVGLIADFFMRLSFFGGGRSNSNGGNQILLLVFGLVAAIVAPLVAAVVQAAVSRQREYLADATGAEITRYPDGLARALDKLQQYGRPLQRQNATMAHLYIADPMKPGLMDRLFSTHPPIPQRIERLQRIGEGF